MKTIERQENMPITIENTEINEFFKMLQEQYALTPKKRFSITFNMKVLEDEQPSYDVPKKYPEEMRDRVKRAKAKAQAKKAQGYSKNQAFEAIYKIQDKISKNIKDQK